MPTMAKRKPLPKKSPPPVVKSWSDRLAALRSRLDLTQVELAARLRISQSQLSAFQAGKRQPTRPIAHLIELLEQGKI